MDWGMERRMAQIIPPETGKAFFLAVDHGYFLGPTRMLENPGETVKELTPLADALFVTRGVLRNSIPAATKPNVILRTSGGNSIVGPTLENETLVVDPEEAIVFVEVHAPVEVDTAGVVVPREFFLLDAHIQIYVERVTQRVVLEVHGFHQRTSTFTTIGGSESLST